MKNNANTGDVAAPKDSPLRFFGWGHYDFEAARKAKDGRVSYETQPLLDDVCRNDNDVWAAAEKLVVEEIRQKHQWMRARRRRA